MVLDAAGASPGAIGASAIAVQLAASGGAARLLELLATLPKVCAPQRTGNLEVKDMRPGIEYASDMALRVLDMECGMLCASRRSPERALASLLSHVIALC